MPVIVALGSFVTTLLGGMAALRIGDRRHLVLGLAAGLMLGVVLFDLLPEALDEQPARLFGVPAVMLATMAGFLALHVIERSASVHQGHEPEYAGHRHQPGVGMLAASGLVGHSLMDGFAIGAAFQAGATMAAVVAIAVISHDFADGFNTYTITSLYGNNRRRALTLLACDAVAPVAGAAITLAFTIPHHILGLYLGFFAGKLFGYVCASHEKGLTVMDHMRRAVRQCYGWSLPYGVSVHGEQDFDATGAVTNPRLTARLRMLARDFRILVAEVGAIHQGLARDVLGRSMMTGHFKGDPVALLDPEAQLRTLALLRERFAGVLDRIAVPHQLRAARVPDGGALEVRHQCGGHGQSVQIPRR